MMRKKAEHLKISGLKHAPHNDKPLCKHEPKKIDKRVPFHGNTGFISGLWPAVDCTHPEFGRSEKWPTLPRCRCDGAAELWGGPWVYGIRFLVALNREN